MDNKKMTEQEILEKQLLGLRRLLSYFDGDKQKMAEGLDVSDNVVYVWFNRGRISAKMAIKAEKVTRGKITKQSLRPDVIDWII